MQKRSVNLKTGDDLLNREAREQRYLRHLLTAVVLQHPVQLKCEVHECMQ